MRGAALVLALLAANPAAADMPLRLSSGLVIELHEVIWDEESETGRFRYIAPDLTSSEVDPGALADDLQALCRETAIPRQRATRPGWTELVISLSSEALPFGTSDPEIAQVFEGFEISGEDCIWTAF